MFDFLLKILDFVLNMFGFVLKKLDFADEFVMQNSEQK